MDSGERCFNSTANQIPPPFSASSEAPPRKFMDAHCQGSDPNDDPHILNPDPSRCEGSGVHKFLAIQCILHKSTSHMAINTNIHNDIQDEQNGMSGTTGTHSAGWAGWRPRAWFWAGEAAVCTCSQTHNPVKKKKKNRVERVIRKKQTHTQTWTALGSTFKTLNRQCQGYLTIPTPVKQVLSFYTIENCPNKLAVLIISLCYTMYLALKLSSCIHMLS